MEFDSKFIKDHLRKHHGNFVFFLVLIILMPIPALAQEFDIFESFDLSKLPLIFSGLAIYIVRFALILFGIWILYSGIKFLLSRGNPQAYGEAKKTFLYSLIGGLVIYGVYTIIETLKYLLINTGTPL